VLLREPEDTDPVLRDSYLLARGSVPENTIATLEAGIQRLQGLRFLPRGPPAKRREVIDRAHRGMGRPPEDSFVRMLEKRGVPEEDYGPAARAVASNAEPTRATAPLPPRNRTTPPRAYAFLDVVGLDSFVVPRFVLPNRPRKEDRTVLHAIDFALRWHEAGTYSDKSAKATIEKLNEIWVHRWGDAYTYFFDLGGEFDNAQMERYCAEASAEMLTAPRGAHYMHGLTERNGYLLKVLITRILLEDPSLPFETVVQEAAAQKRAYDDVDGQTP